MGKAPAKGRQGMKPRCLVFLQHFSQPHSVKENRSGDGRFIASGSSRDHVYEAAQATRERTADGASAVEMAGLWTPRKTKGRFPSVPTVPWKSQTARFPHFHLRDDEAGWKSGNPKRGFPLFHRLEDIWGSESKTKKQRLAADRFAPAPHSFSVRFKPPTSNS
jgi:hypothetical protein